VTSEPSAPNSNYHSRITIDVSIMILHIARVILIIFEVLALFNLLIIVHELGHFLAARWRGLYIEKFGVWFGKPIWKKKINGVEYSLGSLPFGGFVALPQLAPMDIIEGKADIDRGQLPKISAFDKIIVAFAGPLFSFLPAETPLLALVLPDSPAAIAGIQANDLIVVINSNPLYHINGIYDFLRENPSTPIQLNLKRNGADMTVPFEPGPLFVGEVSRDS